MAKGRGAGLLKRSRSITGVNSKAPKSIKPQQARLLIRRFHILQKNKVSILAKLAPTLKKKTPKQQDQELKEDERLTEANYKDMLSTKKEWRKFYVPASELDADYSQTSEVTKIDSSLTVPQLYEQLGKIDSEIDKRGGLAAYQTASIHGQTSNRGGDSSKKLVEWLKEPPYKDAIASANDKFTALEIGCLNHQNLISTCAIFSNVTKIDLNSQSPHILQQNFMERPLPKLDKERFNMVLCSLVLNFVPTPAERGEMLRRITKFLRPRKNNKLSSLFFVLPLPCLDNSRYIDKRIFEDMMSKLGFVKSAEYEATKIIYYLFDWDESRVQNMAYAKKKIYDGPKRNNFSIVFE